MNNKTTQTTEATDVYSLVNDRIISLLEQGTIPWRQPWKDGAIPQNIISKRPYRGINHLLLNSLPYNQPFFLTWKQLKTISASVKKGEKGHMVVFSKVQEKPKEGGGVEKRSILRYYYVFNVEQCTDIPKAFLPEEHSFGQSLEPLTECAVIIGAMENPPKIQHKKNEAYYNPATDTINLPKQSSFESSEEYYSTLFHELIHSTGHEKRLNRKEIMGDADYGSKPYSVEELVAEIGACYLMSYAGISAKTLGNSASYIEHWLQRLKEDKRFIIKASSQSQRAVEHILKIGTDTTDKKEEVMAEGVEG